MTIRLDPRGLTNPDADIRYELPVLLHDRSDGTIREDGYEYEDDDVLVLYLEVDDEEAAIQLIERVLQSERVLGNDLSGSVTVAPA